MNLLTTVLHVIGRSARKPASIVITRKYDWRIVGQVIWIRRSGSNGIQMPGNRPCDGQDSGVRHRGSGDRQTGRETFTRMTGH
jgi:hypothetical protein